MDKNEVEFINFVDVMSNGCRIRKAFIRNWKIKGLNWSLKYAAGYTEKQRELLEQKARELGIE
jgi:hypothetical protein